MGSGNGNHEEQLYKLRHSTAHVMAEAVLQMFPEGKLAFGPPVENGFYYDFDLPRPLSADDLAEIERRMVDIVRGDYPFVQRDVSVDEAQEMFAGQPYKLDQIEKLSSGQEDEHGESGAEPVDQLHRVVHLPRQLVLVATPTYMRRFDVDEEQRHGGLGDPRQRAPENPDQAEALVAREQACE